MCDRTEQSSSDGQNVVDNKVVNLEDVLKRLVHRFTTSRFHGHPSKFVGRAVAPSCAAESPSYYKDVFSDSCTALTQEFSHAVVPFLADKGIRWGRLPSGKIVDLEDVQNYRGNYADNSVPMFGRISHDVLGNGEWFVDISGGQFRGQRRPAICWFDSVDALHESFQGRPLQSFRALHGDGGGFIASSHDEGVAKEMERLVSGLDLERCCEWCLGKGSFRCGKCKSVWFCGPVCQRFHWKNGHKSKCATFS